MDLINKYIKQIPLRFYKILIASSILGVVFHGMMYFNIWPGHDNSFVYISSNGNIIDDITGAAGGGRFLQGLLYYFINPTVNAPWLSGVVMILCCAFGSWFVSDAFSIKSDIWAIFISALIISNPTVISSNCFIGYTYAFSICIFTSCLSFWYFIKEKYLLFFIFFFITCNMYVGYVSAILAFFLVYEILELIHNNNYILKDRLSKHFIMLFCSISVMLLSLGLNIGLARINNKPIQSRVSDVVPSTFNTASLLNRIKEVFTALTHFYGREVKYFKISGIVTAITALISLSIIIYIFMKNRKQYSIMQLILLIVDIICLPFAMNVVALAWSTHSLFWFSFISPWLFLISYCDRIEGTPVISKKANEILVLSVMILCISTFSHWLKIANIAYTKTWANYEAGIQLANRVVDRIESIDGYVPGETPVLFIGDIKDNYIRDFDIPAFKLTNNLVGVFNLNSTAFINMDNFVKFIQQELCINMNIIDSLSQSKIDISSNVPTDFNEILMAYPCKDCYMWYGDVLIFKVSD